MRQRPIPAIEIDNGPARFSFVRFGVRCHRKTARKTPQSARLSARRWVGENETCDGPENYLLSRPRRHSPSASPVLLNPSAAGRIDRGIPWSPGSPSPVRIANREIKNSVFEEPPRPKTTARVSRHVSSPRRAKIASIAPTTAIPLLQRSVEVL